MAQWPVHAIIESTRVPFHLVADANFSAQSHLVQHVPSDGDVSCAPCHLRQPLHRLRPRCPGGHNGLSPRLPSEQGSFHKAHASTVQRRTCRCKACICQHKLIRMTPGCLRASGRPACSYGVTPTPYVVWHGAPTITEKPARSENAPGAPSRKWRLPFEPVEGAHDSHVPMVLTYLDRETEICGLIALLQKELCRRFTYPKSLALHRQWRQCHPYGKGIMRSSSTQTPITLIPPPRAGATGICIKR